MSGRIDEMCFWTLEETVDPDQRSLHEYTSAPGSTTIAVVREPNDTGIVDVCDEWAQSLGMPKDALRDFWELRSQYRENDGVYRPSDRAYRELELDERYVEYVRHSDEAQTALDDIVDRILSGEDITLVCFEEDGKCCHRHELLSMIESRLSLQSSKDSLSGTSSKGSPTGPQS